MDEDLLSFHVLLMHFTKRERESERERELCQHSEHTTYITLYTVKSGVTTSPLTVCLSKQVLSGWFLFAFNYYNYTWRYLPIDFFLTI